VTNDFAILRPLCGGRVTRLFGVDWVGFPAKRGANGWCGGATQVGGGKGRLGGGPAFGSGFRLVRRDNFLVNEAICAFGGYGGWKCISGVVRLWVGGVRMGGCGRENAIRINEANFFVIG